MAVTCPTLKDHLDVDQCLENLAGLGTDIYVFDKNDLSAPLAFEEGEEATYGTPAFNSGKGLYKFAAKDDSQQIESSSLGPRKGFSLTFNFVIEQVSKALGVTNRALNNLNLGFIIQDGEEWQILYDPVRRGKFDNDGIKTDTGAAASDDRQTTYAYKLEPVRYSNLYVKAPTEGWDSLLASKSST